MPVPHSIPVRISSEAVESIAITPVVVQDMRLDELVDVIVSGTGKDMDRVREILHRGSFVRGGSRFRWSQLEVTDMDVTELLRPLPDPDPQRRFDASACFLILFRGTHSQIRVDTIAAKRRRLFRRRSLWDELLTLTSEVSYAGYSYGERADMYRVPVTGGRHQWLRDVSRLSPFSGLAQQIDSAALDTIEFYVKR